LGQGVALVARLDPDPIRADLSIEEQVKERHPLWFPARTIPRR
jgi:hypothetical protein